MRQKVIPGVLSAVLSLSVLGLAADASGVVDAEPVRKAAVEPAAVQAPPPEPVRQAKSACKLVVGWPGCKPKPKQPAAEQQPAPAPYQPPEPQSTVQVPACGQACQVERAANTPAERPAPRPDMPEFPDDDEGAIDLGTLTPPPPPE